MKTLQWRDKELLLLFMVKFQKCPQILNAHYLVTLRRKADTNDFYPLFYLLSNIFLPRNYATLISKHISKSL